MEAKVHLELSTFLSRHSLEDAIQNIDEIVLAYLVGVVELVTLEDDNLDLEDVIDMMNAYLPGFEMIGRAEVIGWMLGMAKKLMNPTEDVERTNGYDYNEDGIKGDHKKDSNTEMGQKTNVLKFPCYDYTQDSKHMSLNMNDNSQVNIQLNKTNAPTKDEAQQKVANGNFNPITFISSPPLETAPHSSEKHSTSKRKGRQLSCSSQDSQDEKADILAVEDEEHVKILQEMFPSACTMEARHCLQLSAGDMDRAAQLIMDRQETGQAITGKTKKNNKVKKILEYKLDDDSIKSCVLQKYSFVDTEEDKKTFRPPPLKGEAKKLVRYRDGQVVSMKGEKFSEVSKKEPDQLKSTYVNLKPARKYRFH
ncbi:CUE domain-containing protein 2-like isoform X2 [Physella acuta]|uniref:CUE domain-containing protein 2-like isoform X2 n=1 Tax=Physella acuta TaxID=109671 RepID=UPI0027DBCEA7|nr:CUE domain-containing protein 2-like isoform X2 [Physella acuta]